MNAMLQAAPQTVATAPKLEARATAQCPECMSAFAPHPRQPGQMFCSTAHRDAWTNRMTVRGRVLTPLSMAARQTRGGIRGEKEAGKRARRDAERLMAKWRDEDAVAGRMQADRFQALRYRKGFDPL